MYTTPGLHWQCSSWFLWGWCADCGGRHELHWQPKPASAFAPVLPPDEQSVCDAVGVNDRILTFFHADFGKEFPSRNLRGEVHLEIAPLQTLCCALCSTEQSTFRGREKGEKVLRKGEEEGWPAKGAKRKKGCVKTGQDQAGAATGALQASFAASRRSTRSSAMLPGTSAMSALVRTAFKNQAALAGDRAATLKVKKDALLTL